MKLVLREWVNPKVGECFIEHTHERSDCRERYRDRRVWRALASSNYKVLLTISHKSWIICYYFEVCFIFVTEVCNIFLNVILFPLRNIFTNNLYSNCKCYWNFNFMSQYRKITLYLQKFFTKFKIVTPLFYFALRNSIILLIKITVENSSIANIKYS